MEDNKIVITEAVIDFIENHIEEKLNLTKIAQAVHYSKYHLHRMFTDVSGMTIRAYVQRRQLTRAAELLIFSRKAIIDIAVICGYESQQAFTVAFREMYKKAPADYRKNRIFYPLQLRFRLYKENKRQIYLTKIRLAEYKDILAWIELVKLVIDGYPYFDEADYLMNLKKCIKQKRALILECEDKAVGIMAFSYRTGNIEFFGIHPQYRNEGIEEKFLNKLQREFLPQKDIYITTYREKDKADTGYRIKLKQLGFIERELLIEFGYPTQRFVLIGKK